MGHARSCRCRAGFRCADGEVLAPWTRTRSVRAGLAQRGRIVLLAADRVSNRAIAERVEVSRPTVIKWQSRLESLGLDGL